MHDEEDVDGATNGLNKDDIKQRVRLCGREHFV